MLKTGADVNLRCSKGNTSMHAAFELGNIEMIISFIDCGGDLNVVNDIGMTPLANGSLELLNQLGLQKGVTTI